ncbi:quinol-cytochrome oxidoreductase complex cytochrome b subunit [Pedobacter sp. UYP30]|uniref:hypothetical protein n=1 Tax=Pedobacter sp. UYP30 TaxID=1756400 RepID=UPI003390E940
MKLRVTPLNIVGAISVAYATYRIINPTQNGALHFNTNGILILVLGCLAVVTFITDLIFRFTLKSLKRVWIVELIFIVIAIVLMLILQKVA